MSNSINELDNIRPTNPANLDFFEEAKQEVKEVNAEQQQAKDTITTKEGLIFKKYSGFSFDDCLRNPQPIKWLIKGLIPEKSLTLIFGESGSYKSFMAVDMACSIACNDIEEWHGKRLKHGHVIYFAGEGSDGLTIRMNGWAKQRGITSGNVTIIDEVFKLDGNDSAHSIEATIANIKQYSDNPAIVFFDTVNAFLQGDENSAQSVGNFLTLCKKIIKELNTTVALVHHSGHSMDTKGRARGSSAFRAAMDSEILVTKSGDENKIGAVLQQTKSKDSRPEKPLYFNMESVIIPDCYEEDGKPVDTLVPELDTYKTELHREEIREKKEREKPLPQSEKTARETYQKAAGDYGSIMTDKKTGNKVIYTPMEEWRKIFYENSSADNVKTRQKQFDRARKKLKEETHILTSTTKNGVDYYCLTIQNEMPADIRRYAEEIREAIKNREAKDPSDRIGNLV